MSLFSLLQNAIIDKTQIVCINNYTFHETPLELLNNSEFTKKWYVYDKSFVEFDKCDMDSTDASYFETNPDEINNRYIVGLDESFGFFIEGILNTGLDNQFGSDYMVPMVQIRELYKRQIEEYVRNNELIQYYKEDDESGNDKFIIGNYSSDVMKMVVKREWYCFLWFRSSYDTLIFWYVNTNPNCVLYGYVIQCSSNLCHLQSTIFHFSEFSSKFDTLKDFWDDFNDSCL